MPELQNASGAIEAPLARPRRAGVSPRRQRPAAPFIQIEPGSLLWNPFQRRGIGKPRAFILYSYWLADELTPSILRAAGFGRDEIEALGRWRLALLAAMPRLVGAIIRCMCRRGDPWCHRAPLERAVAGAAA